MGTLLFSPFACPSASVPKSFSAALAQRSAAKWVTLVGSLGASLKIPSSLPLTSLATFLRCSARLAGPPPPSQRGIRRSRRLAALDSARVAGIQGSFADSQGSRDGGGRRLWCRCCAVSVAGRRLDGARVERAAGCRLAMTGRRIELPGSKLLQAAMQDRRTFAA